MLPGFAAGLASAGLASAGYNLNIFCGVWPSCLVNPSVNERFNLSEQKCISLSERYRITESGTIIIIATIYGAKAI